jgi:hypothetical protein
VVYKAFLCFEMSVVDQFHLELAATTQEWTATDEGEDTNSRGGGHTRPKCGAVNALLRCDSKKVMHCMPEVQCGQ